MSGHEIDKRTERAPASARKDVLRYSVAELMRGGRELVLEHAGADYMLRITANGRLILTK
mgnify:CR=1 FL=1